MAEKNLRKSQEIINTRLSKDLSVMINRDIMFDQQLVENDKLDLQHQSTAIAEPD